MADPFRAVAIRERTLKAGGLILLAGLLAAVAYFQFGTVITSGQVVKAEVLRLGTRPVGQVAGGNLPVVSVRLPDGSVREVQATWADVTGCQPGRSISLVRDGSALQVGKPGCSSS